MSSYSLTLTFIENGRVLRANLNVYVAYYNLNFKLNLRFLSSPRSCGGATYRRANASHAKVAIIFCPRHALTTSKNARPDATAYEKEHQQSNNGYRQNGRSNVAAVAPAINTIVHPTIDCAYSLIIIVGFITAIKLLFTDITTNLGICLRPLMVILLIRLTLIGNCVIRIIILRIWRHPKKRE